MADNVTHENGGTGVPSRNRHLLGCIPFGPNHDRVIGRFVYNGYAAMRGLLFASALFAIAYWGRFEAIDSPLHFLVFLSLIAHGMEGSFYQRQKRFAEFVGLRRGDGDE